MKLYYMPQELLNELRGNFQHYLHYYRENDKMDYYRNFLDMVI